MEAVGEGVDYRDGGVFGKALDLVVAEGTDHHDVHHPRQYPGRVFHRFASTQLAVIGGEKDGAAP